MIRTALAVAVLAFGATALVAQSDPIAARKALMKANGDQNRVATEMLEGKRPFNLDEAKKVLATFAETGEKAPALFPDNSKTGGDTAALPAIWENKADFQAKLAKFAARFQGGLGRDQGSRQLQGSVHRGAQKLRRVPPDLPQADVVIVSRLRGQGGRRRDGRPFVLLAR